MEKNGLQSKKSVWRSWAVASLVFGCVSFAIGLYKLLVYVNKDTYPYTSVNAYVGGDAYNYIINGTYTTAFFVLAGTFLLAAIGLMILHYVYIGMSFKSLSAPEVAVLEDIESNLPQI